MIELETERGGVIDEDSPLRNKFFIDPEVLAYCRSNSLFLPRGEEESVDEASIRIEKEKLKTKQGIWNSWGIYFIIIPTILILMLSLMGVSYSPTKGLILPPILGGDPLTPLLTVNNVADMVEGKAVFVKFMAPWYKLYIQFLMFFLKSCLPC